MPRTYARGWLPPSQSLTHEGYVNIKKPLRPLCATTEGRLNRSCTTGSALPEARRAVSLRARSFAKPTMRVLLVTTNRMQPPIAPVGLTVRGRPASRRARGGPARPVLCDRPHKRRRPPTGARRIRPDRRHLPQHGRLLLSGPYGLCRSWRPWCGGCAKAAKRRSCWAAWLLHHAAEILRAVNADGGVMGEGEFALLRLANGDTAAPGVIWRADGQWRPRPQPADLASLPPMRRDFVDNARYHREGGQLGFETKAAARRIASTAQTRGRGPHWRAPARRSPANSRASPLKASSICTLAMPSSTARSTTRWRCARRSAGVSWASAALGPPTVPPRRSPMNSRAPCAGPTRGIDFGGQRR